MRDGRLNGDLNLSRSLGDVRYKKDRYMLANIRSFCSWFSAPLTKPFALQEGPLQHAARAGGAHDVAGAACGHAASGAWRRVPAPRLRRHLRGPLLPAGASFLYLPPLPLLALGHPFLLFSSSVGRLAMVSAFAHDGSFEARTSQEVQHFVSYCTYSMGEFFC